MALRFEDQLFLYMPEALRVGDTQELRTLVQTVTTWGETVNLGETGSVQRGQLERIMRMFGLWLDRYRYILDSLDTFWDADNVDIDFLPYLAEYLGWEVDRNLSPVEQRKIVRQAVYLYKIKGTRTAFTALFTAIGFDVDVQEFEPTHMFRLNAISRDNLNTLNIPQVDKLVRQIEWMRPINAQFLGLRFTKYLPEVFDEDMQTWRGDTEFVGCTDFFEKYFIKRMEDRTGIYDNMLGYVRGFFSDTGKAVGQALKYDGRVKYGEKFQYYTYNYCWNSENLSGWSKSANCTTVTGTSTYPAGATTGWHLTVSTGTFQRYELAVTGFNVTAANQRWNFSLWLASGWGADQVGKSDQAVIRVFCSGIGGPNFYTTKTITGLTDWGGRADITSDPLLSGNYNINVQVYPGNPSLDAKQSIRLSSPQLELVESGTYGTIKPVPSLYTATNGSSVTRTRHYPAIYSYDYPVISGHFPSDGMILWLIRATDGTIISRIEVT